MTAVNIHPALGNVLHDVAVLVITKKGEEVAALAKQLAPRDTGRLADSIEVRLNGRRAAYCRGRI